jgi:hypothetical protein
LPIYTLTLGEKAVSQTSFNELNLTNWKEVCVCVCVCVAERDNTKNNPGR